ncbi:MAG: ABC transporter ATP-binding protein [Pseudomonadales bacterium]|nr:ABC transporter ATP-binding protein [Pseudomonadales bacterium]
MMPVILEAKALQKIVKRVDAEPLPVLEDVNLSVETGETLAIVGASGSGKSTLLGLLAGLDTPSSGEIVLAGECLTTLDEEGKAGLRARKVGFVFQSFHLLPGLSALENVMLPLELLQWQNCEDKARALLYKVGLGERLHHYPNQLSGGEQQRVAIARAFVCEPAVLFADEPTGNLDARTAGKIVDLLFDLNRQNNTTLILVTHDEKLAARCSRTLRMQAGRLEPEGT